MTNFVAPQLSPQTVEVMERSIVIDCSNIPIVNPWLEKQISDEFFNKMIAGGVTASNITIPSSASPGSSFREAVGQFAMHIEWIEESQQGILIRSVDDIRRAHSEGLAGIIFGPQNADFLEDAVQAVALFHGMGLRVMQLTYNQRNLLGDGCLEPGNAGLSLFGRDVVREMNQVGVVVDLSHCGEQTTFDAIEVSDKPCVFSHANARAVHDNPRNKTDDQIRAMAEKGGVICVLPYADFLEPKGPTPPALEVLVRHVEHVVNLVGIDHVGISTDINDNNETRRIWNRINNPELVGDSRYHKYPIGFDGKLQNFGVLAEVLLEGGFSPADVEAILGGNLMRVFSEAW